MLLMLLLCAYASNAASVGASNAASVGASNAASVGASNAASVCLCFCMLMCAMMI